MFSESGSFEPSICFSMDIKWMLQASRNSFLFFFRKKAVGWKSIHGIYSHSTYIRPKDLDSPLAAKGSFQWRHWPTDFIVGAIIMATKTCR